ncbi:unnamed protein product, partial [Heterosigma akashiwo]
QGEEDLVHRFDIWSSLVASSQMALQSSFSNALAIFFFVVVLACSPKTCRATCYDEIVDKGVAFFNNSVVSGTLGYANLLDGCTIKDTIGGVKAVASGTLYLSSNELSEYSGKSIQYDGSGLLTITPTTKFNFFHIRTFTVAFWAKPTQDRTSDEYLFSNALGVQGFAVTCTSTDQWSFVLGDGSSMVAATGGTCATDSVSFVAVTYNDASDQANLYVDGQLVANLTSRLQRRRHRHHHRAPV